MVQSEPPYTFIVFIPSIFSKINLWTCRQEYKLSWIITPPQIKNASLKSGTKL